MKLPPKLGGVARRRFIRRAGVVPRTKSTSYRGSAQEPPRLRPAKEASRLFFLGAATPPAVFSRDDVFNMEIRWGHLGVRKMAILASPAGALPQSLALSRGHAVSDCLR